MNLRDEPAGEVNAPNEEVERVKALRSAFVAGATWCRIEQPNYLHKSADNAAARSYPMPIVEVPRVVRLGTNASEYRIVDGTLQARYAGRCDDAWGRVLERSVIDVIRDLLANPTERKPADEVSV